MRNFQSLLIAACLGGCAPTTIDSITISPELSADQIASVIDAAEMWAREDDALRVPISISDEDPNVLLGTDYDCESGALGVTSTRHGKGSLIYLCTQEVTAQIVAHELGHAFAPHQMEHLPPGNLMSAHRGIAAEAPTPDDVAFAMSGLRGE